MKVIILAGSNRRNATSTKLAEVVGKRIREAGHEAVLFDLYEKPVPLYDPDADYDGEPAVVDLYRGFLEADAVVLASPEYHGTMTGVLKNALDHLGFEHFDGKPVLALASAGGAVGVSTLTQIQAVVRNLHGINCPEWISIGGDQRSFGPDDEPADPKVRARLERTVHYFLRMGQELRGLRS
ncbi:NADPH-dependent FMN reductase [Gorillibacterium sp. sgz5001074]|uniref:NADPH-dependent FMN reductase n=1 Tax=Gorillibacterium sp. sgz5001074 TaxID=3446695 RepID=UPI003F67D0C8